MVYRNVLQVDLKQEAERKNLQENYVYSREQNARKFRNDLQENQSTPSIITLQLHQNKIFYYYRITANQYGNDVDITLVCTG